MSKLCLKVWNTKYVLGILVFYKQPAEVQYFQKLLKIINETEFVNLFYFIDKFKIFFTFSLFKANWSRSCDHSSPTDLHGRPWKQRASWRSVCSAATSGSTYWTLVMMVRCQTVCVNALVLFLFHVNLEIYEWYSSWRFGSTPYFEIKISDC